jgi:sensor histidine kinase YesM
LKLYFGDRSAFQIENHEGGGIFVIIKLPVETGGGTDESDYY